MSGNILQLARKDAKFFLSKGGFESDIEMRTPDNTQSILLTGFATKHHFSYDTDGNAINAKNVHISIDEDVLVKNGYPVRNKKGEITLIRHTVIVADSSGEKKTYVVRENFPDETLGLIVCILGDLKI